LEAPSEWLIPDWVRRPPGVVSSPALIASTKALFPDLNPPEAESDFYFVQVEDPETAVARIIELVKTRIPKRFGLDPIRDIQVLRSMNCGGAGARSLNIELQAALNPAGDRKVERFGWTFAPATR
jgi:exodeoxyribonuclease V alpha subunit